MKASFCDCAASKPAIKFYLVVAKLSGYFGERVPRDQINWRSVAQQYCAELYGDDPDFFGLLLLPLFKPRSKYDVFFLEIHDGVHFNIAARISIIPVQNAQVHLGQGKDFRLLRRFCLDFDLKIVRCGFVQVDLCTAVEPQRPA